VECRTPRSMTIIVDAKEEGRGEEDQQQQKQGESGA
jgi:hypothetical protein